MPQKKLWIATFWANAIRSLVRISPDSVSLLSKNNTLSCTTTHLNSTFFSFVFFSVTTSLKIKFLKPLTWVSRLQILSSISKSFIWLIMQPSTPTYFAALSISERRKTGLLTFSFSRFFRIILGKVSFAKQYHALAG